MKILTMYRAVNKRTGIPMLPQEFRSIALGQCLTQLCPDEWRVEEFSVEVADEPAPADSEEHPPLWPWLNT